MENLSMENVVIIGALIVNLLTIIGYSTKHERRMTKIETYVAILVNRSGIHTRQEDLSELSAAENRRG